MRYTMTIVEQLDRAANELATDHPINNRLALILVDNAAELVLHRRCTDHVQRDESYRMLPPKLTPKQRALAVGSYLDGKLKVLEFLGDLSPLERAFIRIAHDYRGELYHVGLRHDDVIRALAGQYFVLCCDLFGRMKPSWRAWGSGDRFTAVAEKYFPAGARPAEFFRMDNEALAKKLLAELPRNIEPLPSALSASIYKAIHDLEGAFKFLVEDNFAGTGATEMLRDIQWHKDFMGHLEECGIDQRMGDREYCDRVTNEQAALEKTWRPRYTRIHWEDWRARTDAIEHETDALEAARLYEALRNDMAYLDSAIRDAAGALDAAIQMEIDRRRGK